MHFGQSSEKGNIALEVVWGNVNNVICEDVVRLWREQGLSAAKVDERISQLVVVMKNESGQIVGVSTAYKTYIRQLRNYLFACRLLIIPAYRRANLSPSLLVATRDFLESVHRDEVVNPAIGLITLVENEYVKHRRNDAVWPNSRMVYIGNSREGHPIMVYYFKGARILA